MWVAPSLSFIVVYVPVRGWVGQYLTEHKPPDLRIHRTGDGVIRPGRRLIADDPAPLRLGPVFQQVGQGIVRRGVCGTVLQPERGHGWPVALYLGQEPVYLA